MKTYDIIIIGAGASGVFMSYELARLNTDARILMIDKGAVLEKRQCPIKAGAKNCLKCSPCHIMNGYGGAGTLSDGKYNITTQFGGDLHNYVGVDKAMELMEYVDEVLCSMGGADARLYSTASSELKTIALRNNLHLLEAKVRHLGTDRNVRILGKIFDYCSERIETEFYTTIENVDIEDDGSFLLTTNKGEQYRCKDLVMATGRSGSKWSAEICDKFGIKQKKNRVDIGVRVELPAEVFKHITDDVYESKIVYKTDKYNDMVRTFCMNPYGEVVAENTNGIVTVNGHSYADPELQDGEHELRAPGIEQVHGAVSKTATSTVNRSAKAVEHAGRRRAAAAFRRPRKGQTKQRQKDGEMLSQGLRFKATPGDLSLVIPKRQLDNIIEMIYALDKIAPGTANEDTLLYGVEVKFYNSKDRSRRTPAD